MGVPFLRRIFVVSLRFLFLYLVGFAFSPAQESPSFLVPEAQVSEASSRILKTADKAGCRARECKILVANFTFGSGLTSQLGLRLADQFSKELASQQNEIQIIDRSALGAYLEQERIPAALLNNEKAMRWLGKQLGATTILTGLIEDKASSLQTKLQLLSCDDEKARSETELTLPQAAELKEFLTGTEAFPQKPADANSTSDSAIPRAGKDGVTQPACIYCPSPSPGYTQASRDAKFNGSILMDVVLSQEGRVLHANIVRGAPYGLNELAIRALQDWKLKPATLDRRPVTTKVNIEIMFRLN